MSVKIIQLVAERFKRLIAVQIEPKQKGLTVIGGKNGEGKTSVLDSISFMLGGERKRPSNIKNRGSVTDPYLSITLSNGLTVERRGKNSSLKVTGGAGQNVLNEFIEELALDLPKFLSASDSAKAKTLLKIIGAGDKLDAFDAEEKRIFDERRDAGREADRLETEFEAMPFHDDAPDESVNVDRLLNEIDEAEELTRKVIEARLQEQGYRDGAAECQREISDLEDQIRNLRNNEKAHLKLASEHETKANTITVPDVAPLKEKIASAEPINKMIMENERHAEKRAEAKQARAEHSKLNDDIEKVRDQRIALLAGVEMPLDGLSVADGQLVYNGDLWDCMSGADQLRVATSIVKQLKPECGFVLLDKLEQFDEQTLFEFGMWAHKQDLQIIGTRVSTGDENSIIIEDGQISTNSEN